MKKNPLTIRGLDDKVIENLKARARMRRHSLEAELREILSQAARQPLVLDPLAEADRIAAMTPLARPPMAEERPLLCAGGKP
jgi:plasmid stability protein